MNKYKETWKTQKNAIIAFAFVTKQTKQITGNRWLFIIISIRLRFRKKYPKTKSGDIYIAEEFLYHIFLVYSAFIYLQVCLILLRLLKVCQNVSFECSLSVL